MHCENCQNQLNPSEDGIAICSKCGRVNLSESVRNSIYNPSNTVEGPKPETPYPLVLPRRKFNIGSLSAAHGLLAASAGAFIIAGILLFTMVANISASHRLDDAIALDKKGSYQKAGELLDNYDSIFIAHSIKTKAKTEKSKNEKWQKFSSYQDQADKLLADKKYPEAMALLTQISEDYPGYDKVKSAIDKIRSTQVALQKQTGQPKPTDTKQNPTAAKLPARTSTGTVAASCPISTTISGKRFTSTAEIGAISGAGNISEVQQHLQNFFNQYGMTVEITSVSPSSYVTAYDTYSLLSESDLCSLKIYAGISIDEWSKYPLDWIQNSGVKYLVLVKNLAIQGQLRSATPDIVGNAMYYDPTYSGDYAREVIHHEFDHLFTYHYSGSYSPYDSAWMSYNPPGFSYGNGGASCYTPGNCLTGEHPLQGFVTGYGTSGIEEDKAELYAYLMTGTYYHHLQSWLGGDPYLASKVANYKSFIASHSSSMTGAYYDQINP